jgi:hypothetical protein
MVDFREITPFPPKVTCCLSQVKDLTGQVVIVTGGNVSNPLHRRNQLLIPSPVSGWRRQRHSSRKALQSTSLADRPSARKKPGTSSRRLSDGTASSESTRPGLTVGPWKWTSAPSPRGSAHRAAAHFLTLESRLDTLILNAGIMFPGPESRTTIRRI